MARPHRVFRLAWVALPILAAAPGAAQAGDLVVDTTSDQKLQQCSAAKGSGNCSLRGALAMAVPGTVIKFDIFNPKQNCTKVCTTKPLTPLPLLDKGSVTVDGTTQPKPPAGVGPHYIEIDGSQQGGGNGLETTSGGNTIKGLIVNRFASGSGIYLRLVGPAVIEGGAGAGGSNHVLDNYIGTDDAGAKAAANRNGVTIDESCPGNEIAGNLISGNSGNGVEVHSSDNTIKENAIGSDATRDQKIANGYGVYVSGKTILNNTIGPSNLISGNGNNGIYIIGNKGPRLNLGKTEIKDNKIGTKGGGTATLSNGGNGIHLLNNMTGITISGNCVSGNDRNGILISGDFAIGGHRLIDNMIGPTCAGDPMNVGTAAGSNLWDGISIDASYDNVLRKNEISGNGMHGIQIQDTHGVRIESNVIGATALTLTGMNRLIGVYLSTGGTPKIGVFGNYIGPNNLITGNAVAGVAIAAAVPPNAPSNRNLITKNLLSKNDSRGIGLGTGANDDMPAPAGLKVATANPIGGTPAWTLTGTAQAGATIEIFKAHPDSSKKGQGFTFEGSVKANAAGAFSFTFKQAPSFSVDPLAHMLGLSTGDVITATATDAVNNTSEFSDNISVP